MKKVLLIILDGWGIGNIPKVDAIKAAHTPVFDMLLEEFSHSKLITFGEAVGLPKGQMGNSEVGHLNIGAGRIVWQDFARINNMIENDELKNNKTLIEAASYSSKNNKPLHLLGLLSDGGVHSHINHLKALIKIYHNLGVPQTYIHAFTDGRDTDPKKGIEYVEDLETYCKDYNATVVSVVGRYYAMDRDKRWERIKLAYDLLIEGKGEPTNDLIATIKKRYDNNETDEFLKPIIKTNENGQTIVSISADDVLCFFNFRTDRCRQIVQALTQSDFADYEMKKIPLKCVTLTQYDSDFSNINIVIRKENLKNTLGEIIANNKLTQLRAAETEKYPHVTFFFSGGRETPFKNEERLLVNSPKVATYDLQPEMSAPSLTEQLIEKLANTAHDFCVVNFANTDMVGHTGVFKAAIKAAEVVDECLKKILHQANISNYLPIIIADHGNADLMKNDDGSPHTAHTVNLVPIIVAHKNYKVQQGKLSDLAPTILNLMNLPVANEMDGSIIISKK